MARDEIHVGDAGTIWRHRFKDGDDIIDISQAGTIEVLFLSPASGATLLTRTMSLTTDGTDGLAQYLIQAADFDAAGCWQFQAHLVIAALSGDWHSDILTFTVFPNLT